LLALIQDMDLYTEKKEDNMSNFIKLSDLKEKKLKEAEMQNARGGITLCYAIELPVLDYGIIDPPW
jgi:hypothetical protein